MKLTDLENLEEFDTEKASNCIQELESVLSKYNMTVAELILVYGNLGYKLGANLRRQCYDPKFVSEPPDLEYLNKLYYLNPTEDVSLMLTGITITSWIDDLMKEEKNDMDFLDRSDSPK